MVISSLPSAARSRSGRRDARSRVRPIRVRPEHGDIVASVEQRAAIGTPHSGAWPMTRPPRENHHVALAPTCSGRHEGVASRAAGSRRAPGVDIVFRSPGRTWILIGGGQKARETRSSRHRCCWRCSGGLGVGAANAPVNEREAIMFTSSQPGYCASGGPYEACKRAPAFKNRMAKEARDERGKCCGALRPA